MKHLIMALCLMIPSVSFAGTAVLQNLPVTDAGITATNYYGIIASGSACPTPPWTLPVKVTKTGAATGATVTITGDRTGQTACFYATFQAGAVESLPSNVVSAIVPPPSPTGLTIIGPLTIL